MKCFEGGFLGIGGIKVRFDSNKLIYKAKTFVGWNSTFFSEMMTSFKIMIYVNGYMRTRYLNESIPLDLEKRQIY